MRHSTGYRWGRWMLDRGLTGNSDNDNVLLNEKLKILTSLYDQEKEITNKLTARIMCMERQVEDLIQNGRPSLWREYGEKVEEEAVRIQ